MMKKNLKNNVPQNLLSKIISLSYAQPKNITKFVKITAGPTKGHEY